MIALTKNVILKNYTGLEFLYKDHVDSVLLFYLPVLIHEYVLFNLCFGCYCHREMFRYLPMKLSIYFHQHSLNPYFFIKSSNIFILKLQ